MRTAPRLLTLLLAVAAAALPTACGSDDDTGAGNAAAAAPPVLRVSAAASLKAAVTAYGSGYDAARVRPSFAGSDELAAQIRQGFPVDVFLSANTKLPTQLFEEDEVETPVVFATNSLVLAVPAEDATVASLDDLTEPGVTLAIGAASVPVGAYTRTVLDRLPAARRKTILARVRSEEPDVAGVVGKLTQGAVDAGFVYRSDVTGAPGRLKAIPLPADLQPVVEYGAAVVRGSKQPEAARAFVQGLLSGPGAEALRTAGLGAAPG